MACALYDNSLFKIRSAIDCAWAICIAPIVKKMAHDSGVARQTLVPEFGINEITVEATEGCAPEVGIGPTTAVDLRVVDAEGAVYAIFWAAEGDKLTPMEHYVSSRAAFSKSKRGDDKSFPSESYGIELEATGNATRDLEIAKEFGINKITAEVKGGGVLEIGFGPTG